MKKKFGQNFLKNKNIANLIIKECKINNNSIIFEVGPGNGALTNEIIKSNPKQFIAIEIDKSLDVSLLKLFNNDNHKIFFSDALTFNETLFFKKKAMIIGNLPYNISVKLLTKWIHQLVYNPWFNEMVLMFQKEVADRIISKENSKKYGRLTLLTLAFFEIKKILDINKENFFPIPKVNSTVLQFKTLKTPHFDSSNIHKLELLTKNLFSNRRKIIKNKINILFKPEIIKKYNLKKYYHLRAENLSPEIYFFLAKLL